MTVVFGRLTGVDSTARKLDISEVGTRERLVEVLHTAERWNRNY